MRPLNRTATEWSGNLAYIVGLMATDGNLSSDGRHMVFVSKDLQLIKTFLDCLGISCKICPKKSGYAPDKKYFFVQFGDVVFYRFLLSIGLTPHKSKTIGTLKIPREYFFDFLRGSFDGDGSFYSYWDKRWASSHLFYLSFISASLRHLEWIRKEIAHFLNVRGHIDYKSRRACQLKYAKTEAKLILSKIYYNNSLPKLERKFKKVIKTLAVENEHNARVLKLEDRPA